MLFDDWCELDAAETNRKRLWKLKERAAGRAAVAERLYQITRSHYDDLSRIAQDVSDLGFVRAAAILSERLPRSARARSGEIGEILATELIEEKTSYRVPVRRLRYKDGREMALRGDDFLGIYIDEAGEIHLVKGESKSRASLQSTTIAEARATLSRDGGRPTPASMLFLADRLLERGGDEEALGRALRNEVANHAIPASRIEHALFTLSGNAAPQALQDDLDAADEVRKHTVMNLHVADHQAFIAAVYAGALDLGND